MSTARISSGQLVALVASFIMGSSLVLASTSLGHDRWIALLIGLSEALAVAAIFLTLATRFPGRTFVEISEIVYGRVAGMAIASLLLLFAFQLGALVLRNFSDYVSATILFETPPLVISSMLVLVCGMATVAGIESISRCAQLFLWPTLVLVILTATLLFPVYDWTNLLPIAETPLTDLITAGHATASFPFAETVVFLMILPFLNKQRQAARSFVKGMLLGGATLLIAVLRNTAVFGDLIKVLVYPSFSALRMIDIGDTLTRLEILAGINFLTMGFLKVTVCLFSASYGVSQLLKTGEHRSLVFPVALLMLLSSLVGFRSVSESIQFAQAVWPIYAPMFQVGIPLLTLAVALIRRKDGRDRT